MIRNFRALGLAIVAVLAMSAFMASAAQAKTTIKVTTSNSPVSIHATGQNIAEEFTLDGVPTICEVSHYTGTVTIGSTVITVKPSYTNCSLKGTSIATTVTNHDCNYVFTGTSQIGVGTYDASVTLSCGSKGITITSATCAVTIGSQGPLTTVGITNDATDITVTPNVTGITGTVTSDGFLCPYSGVGHKTGGKYVTSSPLTVTAASGTIQISGS